MAVLLQWHFLLCAIVALQITRRRVYIALLADKGKEDLLLDLLSVNKINDALKGKLTGFTSRCFRTARASMKMEEQLSSVQVGGDVTEVELKQVHHDAVEEVRVIFQVKDQQLLLQQDCDIHCMCCFCFRSSLHSV